jgi:hypothetical protein
MRPWLDEIPVTVTTSRPVYRRASERTVVWWIIRATPHILIRPGLWRTALTFLAWPPWKCGPYFRFRYETMYGGYEKGKGGDIIDFMKWAKRFNEKVRSSR